MASKFPVIGEKFPEIHTTTNLGKYILPNDFRGKWLLLFSYPKIGSAKVQYFLHFQNI